MFTNVRSDAQVFPAGLKSADDPEDVAFLHDDQVFTVDLHFGAGPFAEQDLVARLDVQRSDLALFALGAAADGDHFAFLRLFLGGVGNDDPARSLFIGLDSADEDAVMKRPEPHRMYLFLTGRLNLRAGTP